MKCPSCGAEMGGNRFCEYCGTPLSSDMIKEQEQQNKEGCPKCGSTNIVFERENHGEITGKTSKRKIFKTVGVCKDCGHTWIPDSAIETPKKRKTWLWVLGWIFIFPVPLTILMLRKKEMKPVLKYGIIAVAWLVYIVWIFGGNSANKNTTAPEEQSRTTVVESTAKEKGEETAQATTEAAEVTEAKKEDKAEEATKKKEDKTESAKNEDGVDPDFKRQMDAYEAFFDQYIEFMENYDASDTTMLLEYAKLMEKYAQYTKEIDDIDENELSAADSAYYMEVNSRVLKKLGESDLYN